MDFGDKSWMNLRRSTNEYIHGVDDFLDKAFERASKEMKYCVLVRSALIRIGIAEIW